ncbi:MULTISPECIES: hypothetical protein [Pseudomonas fluorescens group]|uniref:Prophage PssSM-02 n=1 Tax=Pseudomonas poae TaxID=200451 RepID=A0ABY0RC21_9PSED|nr:MULTISPECIES: hypothetical protein [Pseudomonas fluorescens group]KRP44098.1 prophage PssSM-02 [Pseudomonas poae]OPB16735.1 hypothetical protein BFW91_01220 [Pseudomonas fluorescens]SDN51743.1 hypothetical protein SAMN04490208_0561 [Pseudomonas poae]
MSPHILIDEALEALEHPSSEQGAQRAVLAMITRMMEGENISVEEFNHYCKRLLRISQRRKETA